MFGAERFDSQTSTSYWAIAKMLEGEGSQLPEMGLKLYECDVPLKHSDEWVGKCVVSWRMEVILSGSWSRVWNKQFAR